MPFKPTAQPEDYFERFNQDRPDGWIAEHQKENLKRTIGDDLWDCLEDMEKHLQ